MMHYGTLTLLFGEGFQSGKYNVLITTQNKLCIGNGLNSFLDGGKNNRGTMIAPHDI
jgi:hypothetical protein